MYEWQRIFVPSLSEAVLSYRLVRDSGLKLVEPAVKKSTEKRRQEFQKNWKLRQKALSEL
jgi:hypothetical protein